MILTRAARTARIRLGAAGERAAASMFANEGCEILARNLRLSRGGELDIVVRDGRTLVFVEVKSRFLKRRELLGVVRPSDGLRPPQKRRIYRAALAYLHRIGDPGVPFRFDLVEVVFNRFGLWLMYHRKAAFGAGMSGGKVRAPSGSARDGGGTYGDGVPMYF